MRARQSLIVVMAAVFCAYFALTIAADWTSFEPLSAAFDVTPAGFVLRNVTPGSVADRAGLRDGDLLTAINGYPARGVVTWTSAVARLAPDDPIRVVYNRDGISRDASLAFGRRRGHLWSQLSGAINILDRIFQIATLMTAVLIAFRARTATALFGSWFLATVGVFSTAMPPGLAAIWQRLPWPIALLLVVPHVSIVSIGGLLFAFCATFQSRWPTRAVILALIPWLPSVAWNANYVMRLLYQPDRLPLAVNVVPAIVALNATYVVIGLAALWINYRNIHDLNGRRRVRIVVAGTIVGTLVGAPAIVSLWLGSTSGPPSFFEPPVRLQLAYTAFLVVPLSLWWAIARHQLYDISFVVRRSLQYMLARRALVVITPLALVLAAVEAMRHDREPIGGVLQDHAIVYAALGAALLVVTTRRAAWLDALDRRFFRDRYDACRLLRSVADRARETRDFWAASRVVVDEIVDALHVEWAAVLVPGAADYVVCAGTPDQPEPWPATLNVFAFVHAVRQPLEVDTSRRSWLRRHVPDTEIAFLERVGVRLIVPVIAGDDRVDALIALGTKKSEEPFSAEDKNLLMTIAGTVADATMSARGAGAAAGVAEARDDESSPLWRTAEALVRGEAVDWSKTAALLGEDERRRLDALRFLVDVTAGDQARADPDAAVPVGGEGAANGATWGSFALIECIGEGSVGTVWRARDRLDRDVAVKLLRADRSDRDHLLGEAKRLARVRHPNVVHVYGADEYGGVSGLWMELIVGETLAEVTRTRGACGAQEAVAIGKTLCGALAAIHQAGLVHQDVKAQNVMRERGARAGRYVLMDLGAGMDAADPSAPRWGTPEYAAPEILFGGRATVESDVYSLGVLLFHLLTGELPVRAASLEAARAAHRESARRWLRDLRPTLSAPLIAAIERAMAAAPERRFASAGAFADALVFDES